MEIPVAKEQEQCLKCQH